MIKRLTTEEFKCRASEIHDNKYDYSKVEYANVGTPVTIICPVPGHGEFRCSPRNHLRPTGARGCPKCGRARQKSKATKPFERFLAEARAAHGDRYAYRAEEYRGARPNMGMVCPEHGDFRQSPMSHLRGAGCPGCAAEARAERYRNEHAEAVAGRIAAASDGGVRLHVESYRGQTEVADFTCTEHGPFRRKVIHALLKLHPCPECSANMRSSFPSDREALLDVILSALGRCYTVEPFEYAGRATEVTLWCGRDDHPSFRRVVSDPKKLRGCHLRGR
jgi:hypothetical protein